MLRFLLCALLASVSAAAEQPGATDHGLGKQGYETACVRCHGDNGNLEDYPNIRKLGGIGKRLSDGQLRQQLHPVPLGKDLFSVRSHLFTERQLQALVRYVRSL